MTPWKRTVVSAVLVTAAVVIGTYLIFRLALGPERMPGSDVVIMISATSFFLFICAKVVSDLGLDNK